jgi:hypothetical protein
MSMAHTALPVTERCRSCGMTRVCFDSVLGRICLRCLHGLRRLSARSFVAEADVDRVVGPEQLRLID